MVSELLHTIDVIVTLQVQSSRRMGDNCQSSSLIEYLHLFLLLKIKSSLEENE